MSTLTTSDSSLSKCLKNSYKATKIVLFGATRPLSVEFKQKAVYFFLQNITFPESCRAGTGVFTLREVYSRERLQHTLSFYFNENCTQRASIV